MPKAAIAATYPPPAFSSLCAIRGPFYGSNADCLTRRVIHTPRVRWRAHHPCDAPYTRCCFRLSIPKRDLKEIQLRSTTHDGRDDFHERLIWFEEGYSSSAPAERALRLWRWGRIRRPAAFLAV